MRFSLFLILTGLTLTASAQSGSGSNAQKENHIKYDFNKRQAPDELLPFNRNFILDVENFPADRKLIEAFVFELKYKKGVRDLKDEEGYPSFTIKEWQMKGNTLELHFPALKAERDLNVMLTTTFSAENIKTALALNRLIHLKTRTNLYDKGIKLDRLIQATLLQLNNGISPETGIPAGLSLPPFTVQTFSDKFYVKADYDFLLDTLPSVRQDFLSYPDYLSQNQIKLISKAINEKNPFFSQLFVLQKVIDDNPVSFNAISSGQLDINYKYPPKLTDCYNLDIRIKNLETNISYFQSLENALNYSKATDPYPYTSVKADVSKILIDLTNNAVLLSRINKRVNKKLSLDSKELSWIFGTSTVSPDVKTLGKRHFTIDLGLTNMMLRNNSNKNVHIRKLAIIANIFFQAHDKNVNFKYIKDVDKKDKDAYNHSLESRNNFFQRFAISAGVTLGGGLSNKEFDNVLGNFSFIAGPSYRIVGKLRLGIGASLIRRVNDNPLISSKSNIIGYSATLSLDQDLLEVAKEVTSLIFK